MQTTFKMIGYKKIVIPITARGLEQILTSNFKRKMRTKINVDVIKLEN